jgi:hypothetical protein
MLVILKFLTNHWQVFVKERGLSNSSRSCGCGFGSSFSKLDVGSVVLVLFLSSGENGGSKWLSKTFDKSRIFGFKSLNSESKEFFCELGSFSSSDGLGNRSCLRSS